MSDAIDCPNCGHKALAISPMAASREYLCGTCGNRFHARVHYLPDPPFPAIKLFRALVDVGEYSSTAKLRMKVERALRGVENFKPSSLESQVLAGSDVWDVGLYAESELSDLKERVAKHGVNIRVVPV